jgi:hypothetical protein
MKKMRSPPLIYFRFLKVYFVYVWQEMGAPKEKVRREPLNK